MKNYAIIAGRKIALSPVDVIQTVANHLGFLDVDIEPGVGSIEVTARREPGTEPVTAKGDTFEELAESFVAKVLT